MSDLVAALSTTGGVATAGIRIVAAGAQEAFQAHASVCKHELAYLMDRRRGTIGGRDWTIWGGVASVKLRHDSQDCSDEQDKEQQCTNNFDRWLVGSVI
ncbi:hypothetical protein [Pseudarthrobacter sp. PS3-L1]|uniref:hypothetical protein n=1 Tax=Pseudarthrobacter sp. PS3-L1 TaxID=3046207 RepID=UPI0024B8F68A|nr:hypothetical protein [Pseudarthrobacter sp. PS3-L1]MDJ0320128.1 hypothetical protein [Pseudarthrobacter sp. PS3-L1]